MSLKSLKEKPPSLNRGNGFCSSMASASLLY